MSRYPTLTKSIAEARVCPNLTDYDRTQQTFTWGSARLMLEGLPNGRGLNIAHEAVDRHAAGPSLQEGDAIVATYREHGHALTWGVPADRIMAEMYGKLEGCCRGRGGSMHIFDAATRFYGGSAIVGGGLPLAVGLALADKMQGIKRPTTAFFGEGAVAEGEFHESLNLAALWNLPVFFVCENNLYAMGKALERSEAQIDLRAKASRRPHRRGSVLRARCADRAGLQRRGADSICRPSRAGGAAAGRDHPRDRAASAQAVMSTFVMPSLGSDMEAGTLVEWLKKPGDPVKRGDIVAVVETQKGAIEVEIFDTGRLDRILVDPGQTVPVGTPLATIRSDSEAQEPEPPPEGPPPGPEEVPPEPEPVPPEPPPETPPPEVPPEIPPGEPPVEIPEPPPEVAGARVRMSPAARRRAGELGLDVTQLQGSGPGGAITLTDVEAKARAPGVAAGRPRRRGFDVAAMRQAIAAAMARSKREIPHYYLSTTVDMTRALAWLERANAERPVAGRLLYGVLLLKAVALALRQHSTFSGFWTDGRFVAGEGIHVGWAIALRGGGLIAPAIRDADRKPLDDLMTDLRDLVRRARSGGLRSSELSDPTITVTSLGEQGVDAVQGVIYPPQVAIAGFGRLTRRPWLDDDDRVVARSLITASLAADHRASDGHQGGRFLSAIERLLQEPEKL